MLYRVEGLVIRSIDYGEGGKIITLLTEEAGKVGVLARGAKKTGSRFSAAVQPFTSGEYVFFRTKGLGTLNSADILTSRRRLREDLYLSAAAAYLAEMTDRLLADGESAPWLARQLTAALDALDDGKDPRIITHLYEMKILVHAGYKPSLDTCAACARPTAHPVLSIAFGGLLCEDCAAKDAEAMTITPRMVKLLRLFETVGIDRVGQVSVQEETKESLKQVMRTWLDRHVDIRFRSRQVLEQLEKAGF